MNFALLWHYYYYLILYFVILYCTFTAIVSEMMNSSAAVKVAETIRPLRTRGKFEQGEKVLCYEPDPEKVKVVYEAKILEIIKQIWSHN